ncbi:MAG TPA: MDR family MFS transporter [Acidimicrobiales bacterium]|nr:MDR family MFS transporter [Acidimicrobiales bacterium]
MRSLDQKIAVSVVYVAAMFMAIMDATIVNVALPTLGRRFGVAPDAVDTVAIGFLVSLAVFIPVSGWLGDRLGGKRVLLGAVAVFTAASAACGTATSLTELVIFRVLQGVGGGLMTPVGMAMLFRVFPPEERVRASSILTIPTAFAPAAGPVLGGLLVTDASWRWVFYVNVPIGLAALVFGAVALDRHLQPSTAPFDRLGFALAGVGFGSLMYGVSEGPIRGWGTTGVTVTLVAGVALVVALVAVELRRAAPLVDLRLFTNRSFRSASLVTLLAGVAFLGTLYGLALFYQDGLGLTALGSGLSTFPEAVGVMLGVQLLTRRLYSRIGPRRLMAGGLVAVAVAMVLLSRVDGVGALWWSRLFVFLMGLGMACVFVPSQTVAFATMPPATTGRASTLFNAQRQIGGAVGVGLLTTVIAAVGPLHRVAGRLRPDLGAYHAAFLAAAAMALMAAGAALTVRDADVAATMTGRPRDRRAAEAVT